MTRQALVTATEEFSEAVVRRMLPPEHAIVAFRPDARRHLIEYLIEGPTLPGRIDGGPLMQLHHLCTLTRADDGTITVVGEWTNLPNVPPWTIGVWPDFEAFQAWRRGRD